MSGYTLHAPLSGRCAYPQAAVAGLAGSRDGLMLPTEELRESGREVEQQRPQHRPEIASMLERLEEQFDQYAQERRPRSLLLRPDEHVPDAEEIGSVVETYLSGQAQQDAAGLDADERDALELTGSLGTQGTIKDPMRPSRADTEPDVFWYVVDESDGDAEDDDRYEADDDDD